MIGMFATKWQPGDFFLGRMALFGRFGTLWPSGVKPDGLGVVFGRQGSGKSTAYAIPSMCLHQNGPLLCFDAKGELAQACFARRGAGGNGVRGLGQKTLVIDPLGITGLPQASYNPLYEIAQEVDATDALRLAMKLAEGLVKAPDGGGGENAWIYSGARDFLYGLILFVVDCWPPDTCNLVTLRGLLLNGDAARLAEAKASGKVPNADRLTPFDALLIRMMEETHGRFGEVVAGQAADVQRMGERQRGAILKEVGQATMWLDLPKFRDAVTRCDFLLRDYLTQPISVFVCLPLNELTGLMSGYMRFVLTMFLQVMFQKNPDRNPLPHGDVLCVVDEFPQFGNLPGFCKVGPTMRDYHVKLLILLQDIGQLRKTYGREEASTFLGCAAYVTVMSMTHDETIEWLVRELGEQLVKERQPDGRVIARPHAVLDFEQAKRYLTARDGNLIALRFHSRPLRLKAANYWWFLPFWMYTPDPRHPEPRLRARAREQATKRAAARARKGERHGASRNT